MRRRQPTFYDDRYTNAVQVSAQRASRPDVSLPPRERYVSAPRLSARRMPDRENCPSFAVLISAYWRDPERTAELFARG